MPTRPYEATKMTVVKSIDFADSYYFQGRFRGDVACWYNTQERLDHKLLTGEIRELQH